MPSAIEELLRYAGIVHTIRRKAIRDIQIGDAAIKAGQKVLRRPPCMCRSNARARVLDDSDAGFSLRKSAARTRSGHPLDGRFNPEVAALGFGSFRQAQPVANRRRNFYRLPARISTSQSP